MSDPQAIAVERETRQRKIMGAEQARVIDSLREALDAAEADKARAVAEALRRVAESMPACTEPGAFCPCDAVARIVRHPGWVADHD